MEKAIILSKADAAKLLDAQNHLFHQKVIRKFRTNIPEISGKHFGIATLQYIPQGVTHH